MLKKRNRIKVVNALLLGKTDSQNRRVEFPHIKGLTFEEMYKKHFNLSKVSKVELRDARIEEEYMTLDHISYSTLNTLIKDAIEENISPSKEGGYCRLTGLAYDINNLPFIKTGSYIYGDSSEPRLYEWRDDGYYCCPHCNYYADDHKEDVYPEGALRSATHKIISLLGYDSWEDLSDEEDLLEQIEALSAEYIADILGAEDYEFEFGGFEYDSEFNLKLKGGEE